MGYYTNYTLDCYDNHANSFDISFATEFGKALTAALYEINPDYFDDDFSLTTLPYQEWKWYDHDEDMIKLSLRFPDYTFILEGEGEENGDLWRQDNRAQALHRGRKQGFVIIAVKQT